MSDPAEKYHDRVLWEIRNEEMTTVAECDYLIRAADAEIARIHDQAEAFADPTSGATLDNESWWRRARGKIRGYERVKNAALRRRKTLQARENILANRDQASEKSRRALFIRFAENHVDPKTIQTIWTEVDAYMAKVAGSRR
jgi:hypothetical protein